jgi:hypothetical protein
LSDTVFDDIIAAFKTVLQQAPAVCAVVETDDVDEVPEDVGQAVHVELDNANPQQLGGIQGNPVEWEVRVRVGLYVRKSGASARPDLGVLLATVYARLAANTNLGLGDGVFIGEPTVDWSAARLAQRLNECDLYYTVRCRTSGLSLA